MIHPDRIGHVVIKVREYATTEERQRKINDNIKIWCEKFSAAQEGGYRVAMGLEEGVQVHLQQSAM